MLMIHVIWHKKIEYNDQIDSILVCHIYEWYNWLPK